VPPAFLTLDEVLAIHAHQVSRYGGALGIRDRGLLESALAMPQATFGDELLHPSLHEQAAAYLFHLVKNHPFIDGNKRVGLASCLAFLRLNGVRIRASDDELVDLVLGVASGDRSKAAVAVLLRERTVSTAHPPDH
jgi:death-on-curing protein